MKMRTDGFASIRNLLTTRALRRMSATEGDVLTVGGIQNPPGEKARFRLLEAEDGEKFVRPHRP